MKGTVVRINPCQGFIDVKDIMTAELGKTCDVVGGRYEGILDDRLDPPSA